MASRDERIDMGWDLLEQGEARGALEAADALLQEDPAHAEAAYLASSALMELGERGEAEVRLRQLLSVQPDNGPLRLTYAGLLYETYRLEEAQAELARLDPAMREEPPVLWLTGLLLDARGRHEEADRCFARAAALDPERYPAPASLPRPAFDGAVDAAIESLPAEFAEKLQGVNILVEEVPSAALLATLEDPSPDLLGLFVGTPLTLESHSAIGSLPPAIYLFKRNLERESYGEEDLAEQIRVTLLHELGHYLGMDEEDLDDAGYA